MLEAHELLISLQRRLGGEVDIALRAKRDYLTFCFQKVVNGELISESVEITLPVVHHTNREILERVVKTQLAKLRGDWL